MTQEDPGELKLDHTGGGGTDRKVGEASDVLEAVVSTMLSATPSKGDILGSKSGRPDCMPEFGKQQSRIKCGKLNFLWGTQSV